MRVKQSVNYVRHLRWVANRLFISLKCYFCLEPLLPNMLKAREWWNLPRLITVHHVDGNHENDHPSNLGVCHVACHRRHHIQNPE